MKRLYATLLALAAIALWALEGPQNIVKALIGALVISWVLIVSLIKMPVTKWLRAEQIQKIHAFLILLNKILLRDIPGIKFYVNGRIITGKLTYRSDGQELIGVEPQDGEGTISFIPITRLEQIDAPKSVLQKK